MWKPIFLVCAVGIAGFLIASHLLAPQTTSTQKSTPSQGASALPEFTGQPEQAKPEKSILTNAERTQARESQCNLSWSNASDEMKNITKNQNSHGSVSRLAEMVSSSGCFDSKHKKPNQLNLKDYRAILENEHNPKKLVETVSEIEFNHFRRSKVLLSLVKNLDTLPESEAAAVKRTTQSFIGETLNEPLTLPSALALTELVMATNKDQPKSTQEKQLVLQSKLHQKLRSLKAKRNQLQNQYGAETSHYESEYRSLYRNSLLFAEEYRQALAALQE